MKLLPLTKGQYASVDDADFEIVSRWKWYATTKKRGSLVYAARNDRSSGVRVTVLMHRFLLGITDRSIDVDHRNHDGRDNQRANLRVSSRQQNAANMRPKRVSVSHFKGVHRRRDISKKLGGRGWSANIGISGKTHHIGSFHHELAAAAAYNASAYRAFGEFAHLNKLS